MFNYIAFFILGMLIGSFIWGYVADSRGRRFTLIICMLMDGFFNILSSVSQMYSIFILCRLLSGFGYTFLYNNKTYKLFINY